MHLNNLLPKTFASEVYGSVGKLPHRVVDEFVRFADYDAGEVESGAGPGQSRAVCASFCEDKFAALKGLALEEFDE